MSGPPSVCIVGGGLSGLITAKCVKDKVPDAEVVLLEAEGRVGGQILTGRDPEGRMEKIAR